MKTLSRFLVLLLAVSATAAMAQVPPISGAPTDRPMPPEPGERTETDRTLDVEEGELDLPQADTGAQLRLLEQSLTDYERDVSTADRPEYDRMVTDFEQRHDDLDTRAATPDMTTDDRVAFMNDYAALDRDLMQARLQLAADDAYHRMMEDRMAMYDDRIARLNDHFDEATGDDRAEYALQLIALRNQRDDLAHRHLQLQYGRNLTDAERMDMRRSLTNDLAQYDADLYDASLEMGAPMYMTGNL